MSYFVEELRGEPLRSGPAPSRPTMLELYLTGSDAWAPGRLTLAGHELVFRPRRSLLDVRLTLDLRSATLVETVAGRFTGTVSFRTPTHLLQARGRASRIAALVDELATPRLVPGGGTPSVPPASWAVRRAG